MYLNAFVCRLAIFPRSTCRSTQLRATSFDITTMRFTLHPKRAHQRRPFLKHL